MVVRLIALSRFSLWKRAIDKRVTIGGVLLLLSISAACTSPLARGGARTESEDKADISAIERLFDRIAAADTAGDLDGVVSLYSDDAMLLPPQGPVVRGAEAIREHYRKLFDAFDLEVKIHSSELRVAGDWAYSIGETMVTTYPRQGGRTAQSRDKYVMLLVRTPDGRWKIHRLIWSPKFTDTGLDP